MEVIKDKLVALRDHKYRQLLNERDTGRRLQLVDELKAIESLAQSLLVDEAQGELAYQALMQAGQVPEETPLRPERPPARRRRSRPGSTTAP